MSALLPNGWYRLGGFSRTVLNAGPAAALADDTFRMDLTLAQTGRLAATGRAGAQPWLVVLEFHALLQATSLAPDPNLANNDLPVTVP